MYRQRFIVAHGAYSLLRCVKVTPGGPVRTKGAAINMKPSLGDELLTCIEISTRSHSALIMKVDSSSIEFIGCMKTLTRIRLLKLATQMGV